MMKSKIAIDKYGRILFFLIFRVEENEFFLCFKPKGAKVIVPTLYHCVLHNDMRMYP